MLLSVWTFLCKLGFYLFIQLRIYKYWSYVHRFFFDGEWDSVLLMTVSTIEEARVWMRGFKYKADGASELFDAVCTPNKVQAVGREEGHHGNDCDEEAIFLSNVFDKSLRLGMMMDPIRNPRFFTVTWVETKTKKAGGHNVCLLEYPQSNGEVWFGYMDWGSPSRKMRTVQEVADLIRDTYVADGKYQKVGWAIQMPDLTPVYSRIG